MGLTKVFFKAGKLKMLDDITNSSKAGIEKIAGKVRGWLARYNFRVFSQISKEKVPGVHFCRGFHKKIGT